MNVVHNTRRLIVPIPHVVDRTRSIASGRKWRIERLIAVVLEWTGASMGIMGSALLALKTDYSGWGFVCFLASNILWIAYGRLRRSAGLIAMNLAFTATSFFGIVNYFLN